MGFIETATNAAQVGHAKADVALAHLAQQTEQLDEVINRLGYLVAEDDYSRRSDVALADAAGNGRVEISTRRGYAHQLLSVSTVCGTGVGVISVWLNDEGQPGNLLRVLPGATLASADFQVGDICPENSRIIVLFTGQVAGSTCTATVSSKRLRGHDPRPVAGVPY